MPPIVWGEGKEAFELEWDKINAGVSGLPAQYPLTLRGQGAGKDESDDEDEIPTLPLICHRVKVQRWELKFYY